MTSEFNLICRNTVVPFFPFSHVHSAKGCLKMSIYASSCHCVCWCSCSDVTWKRSWLLIVDCRTLFCYNWNGEQTGSGQFTHNLWSKTQQNINPTTDAGDSCRQTSHSQTATQTFGTAYFLFKRVSWVPCGTMLRLWSLIWLSCPARRCHISYYWWFHAGSN